MAGFAKPGPCSPRGWAGRAGRTLARPIEPSAPSARLRYRAFVLSRGYGQSQRVFLCIFRRRGLARTRAGNQAAAGSGHPGRDDRARVPTHGITTIMGHRALEEVGR